MNTQQLTIEASALSDLGLLEEATAAIEKALAVDPSRDVTHIALKIFLRRGLFSRAAELADQLLAFTGLTETETHNACLAFNFSGRTRDAYDLEKSIKPSTPGQEISTEYGLACRTSVLGRYRDALSHILRSFSVGNILSWNPWRKAFLDSELAPLWENASSISMSLSFAMRFAGVPFGRIVAENAAPLPLRTVDHADLNAMPERFRSLFAATDEVTFHVSPLQEQRQPEVFREFVRWQQEVVVGRVAVFQEIGRKVRRMLWENQPAMAEFQASHGRFGAARQHLLFFLRETCDTTPASIPAIPLLFPLIEEFSAQHAENPEAFRRLVAWECNNNLLGFVEDGYDSLSPANKSSGLAQLALGNCLYRLGRHEESIRAFKDCRNRWPWDETPVMNIVSGLACIGKWEECETIVLHLSSDFLVNGVRKRVLKRIRNRSLTLWKGIRFDLDVPTPSMGGLYPGGDKAFLAAARGRKEPERTFSHDFGTRVLEGAK